MLERLQDPASGRGFLNITVDVTGYGTEIGHRIAKGFVVAGAVQQKWTGKPEFKVEFQGRW